MLIAVTRGVSSRFAECELTHLAREPINVGLARSQHAMYADALRSLGVVVEQLPAVEDLPDCVFVEDCAVVLDEVAVIARPGAESRREETAAVAAALAQYRDVLWVEAPGTLDGGDVLVVGRDVYVGRTDRSNQQGSNQLSKLLAPFGYRVIPVPVHGCLHLKSAVSLCRPDCLLINPKWVDRRTFRHSPQAEEGAFPKVADVPSAEDPHPSPPPQAGEGVKGTPQAGEGVALRIIEIDPSEPFAANCLYLPSGVIYPSHFPRTRSRLVAEGVSLTLVEASEVAKAEGGVTCCSLVFNS